MEKKLIFALAATVAALAPSCSREPLSPENKPVSGNAVTLTVSAVTKNPATVNAQTKISYGAVDATWEDGDKIFLIKNDGTTITLTLSEGAGTSTGSFSSSDPVVAGTYIPYAVSGEALDFGYVSVSEGTISLDLNVPGGPDLNEALKHDVLKGTAITLTAGQTEATITGLNTHILSILRFRFTSTSKAITTMGISSAGGVGQQVSIAPSGTVSSQNPTTMELSLPVVGDDGMGTYSGYFAIYGSTSTSLVVYAEDEDGGKYARLVSTKTANYTPGEVYGKDYTLSDEMVSAAAEGTLSSQTWENLGLSVKWAKYNYGSSSEYSQDRNVDNNIDAVPAGWSGWRFPTRAEAQELFYACSRQWVGGGGVRFDGPNGNYVPMGAGGRYRVRDDGNDWDYGIGSDVYFYIDETTTSNGGLARLWAVIGSEGNSLSFGSANHGSSMFWFDDYVALRLVCDY